MPVVSPHQDNRAMVHVARQAILDARGHVVGYELLYRGSVRDTACTVEGDVAGASVLTGAMLDLRLDTLTDGRTPFINVTRSMLINGIATLLRPSLAVFELREDIAIDAEVIDACRALCESGYRLALDDFVPGSPAVTEQVRRLAAEGVTVVAEKVETREVFEWTRDAGCGLFQGHYFRKPETRSAAVTREAGCSTEPARPAVHQLCGVPDPPGGAIDRRGTDAARCRADPQMGVDLVSVQADSPAPRGLAHPNRVCKKPTLAP